MTLSIIVPCYNAEDTLAVQLAALAGQKWSGGWELLIADNGSTDRSREIAAEYEKMLPQLTLLDASDRKGPAHARNVGARHASGESLIFCDADDEVEPGWLAAMGSALSKHEFVAGRLSFDKLNPQWLVSARRSGQEGGLRTVNYPPYLKHAPTANLGVRRALHEAVGGFDESMSCLEDTDYCFRIQMHGAELHFIPEAVVNYRFRPTMGSIYWQSQEYSRFRHYLEKKYRDTGPGPIAPWKNYAKGWKKVILGPLRIRNKSELAKWMKLLGQQVGRTRGIIEFRVPPV